MFTRCLVRTTAAIAIPIACAASAIASTPPRPVLLVHPTKIVFEGRTRGATLQLVNRGDAPGVFLVDWVDYRMTPEGGLAVVERPEWSVSPHVRISPQRVTLEPGGHQVVKLALRPQLGVELDELRSHLRVLALPLEEVGPDGDAQRVAASTSVTVRSRTAMAVPVIWRPGRGVPEAEIVSARVDRSSSSLEVNLRRHGGLSARGLLQLVVPGADADRASALAELTPAVIYPELSERTVSVPLTRFALDGGLPAGAVVQYVSEPDDQGRTQVLSSAVIAGGGAVR